MSRSDVVIVGIFSIGIFGSFTDYVCSKIIERYIRKRGIFYEK